MLSTCHSSDMIEKRRRTRAIAGGTEVISKPQMVEEYNQHIGGGGGGGGS